MPQTTYRYARETAFTATTSAQLIPARTTATPTNPSVPKKRMAVMIKNDSASDMYIKFGDLTNAPTMSSTDFHEVITTANKDIPLFIDGLGEEIGVWVLVASGTGAGKVVEFWG